MGSPLSDITIYYSGTIIKDTPYGWEFRKTVNYISDFYHNRLNGYKPPKTSRICITLDQKKHYEKPYRYGSICSYGNIIDEYFYLKSDKIGKYEYILSILHSTILEIAEFYNWDKEIFTAAYEFIKLNNYKFERIYSIKKSRNRLSIGEVILIKTEEQSIIDVAIHTNNQIKRATLIVKKNWFWYDSIYKIAKKITWIDNHSFGIKFKKQNSYLSLIENAVINKVEYPDEVF